MSTPSPTPPRMIEIRKYPNRRYYDTTRSRHLTLEDIRKLIREGTDVRIVDSQTGADLTSKTLTQMILEFDAPKLELFTVPLLTEMIRVNDQVMKGFFEKFFHQALSSFLTFQQQFERQLQRGGVLPSLFPPFLSWMAPPDQNSPPGASWSADARHVPANAELVETVQQLQRQVAALQEKLNGAKRIGPRKRSRAGSRD